MRHIYLLPTLAIVASCSFPQHVAKRTIEDTLSTDGIRQLHCTSHNGDITIHARPDSSELRMRVKMSVRGYSQSEAEANLELLDVRAESSGDLLTLIGRPDPAVRRMSPSFTFELEAPPHLVQKLISHNGDIRAFDTNAALDCETHNGNIEVGATTNEVRFVTHNGDLDLSLKGSGGLNGVITTHNGSVVIAVAPALGTSLNASTHNGSISLNRQAQDTSRSRRHLSCKLGSGSGQLEIETHNGNVEIR